MPKKKRASVGLAVIARDAAETLPLLLKSVRPYIEQVVVGVDELTKDRTARVAARAGADRVFQLHVSDWHECEHHGRVLAQHFANARQASFAQLDPTLDFWLWLDADDVLEGAERLPALCDGFPADAAGAWWEYHYAAVERADGTRFTNTLFHRERLLRTHAGGERLNWTWSGRVHETVKPDRELPWVISQDLRVVHQPGVHQTDASARRNLLLLEIDYEEDPAIGRTLFYLGNQHFAMGNWQQAVDWYERLTDGADDNPYELWQAYVYMSLAYERLGDLTNAARAAYGAMDVRPQHPEPYLRLAAISHLSGDSEKGLFWDELAGKMKQPPFFVFKNPLDYTFNRLVLRGEAQMALGQLENAHGTWQQAAQVFTDERLMAALDSSGRRIEAMRTAEGFVQLASAMNGQALDVYDQLPAEVKAFGRTRDAVMPLMMAARPSGGRRIVFWCGRSLEPWAPPTLNTTGIGGSETAVIEIAKRFAADGWTVDVFNDADRFEGLYDGVGYWDCRRLVPGEKLALFISWRNPSVPPIGKIGLTNVLWCHDLNYGPDIREGMNGWDHVFGVSEWHAAMLSAYYGIEAEFVPNGVDLNRFTGQDMGDGEFYPDIPRKKVPFRCVYASSPDRGLVKLLDLWPEIVKAEPAAELHIAYGWENIDRMIAQGRTDLVKFREDMTRMIERSPRTVWRGRLGQDTLARLYGESVAWLYPADFLEVSCISAMEAMAAGCVPVATRAGALPETIGLAGFLIPGPPQSRAFGDMFPKAVLGVLTDPQIRRAYGAAGRERAKTLTWDAAYQRWKAILGLEGESMRGSTRPRTPATVAGYIPPDIAATIAYVPQETLVERAGRMRANRYEH